MAVHRKNKPEIMKDFYNEGVAAYVAGITDKEAAQSANPYRLFGNHVEHMMGVSWNKGWNDTKKAATS